MRTASFQLGIMLIIAIRTALLSINIVFNFVFLMLLFDYYVRSTHLWALMINLKARSAMDGRQVCARSIFAIPTAEW